jgi:tRNA dimethylallyltransferase
LEELGNRSFKKGSVPLINIFVVADIKGMNSTLVIITGPTATGKTAFSITAASYFNTEIISADSRQMYREMVIGTAVPALHQTEMIRHHFLHSLSIHDYYNASMFEEEVLSLLEVLFKSHNVVIMTGGSMLYIDAVCKGIDDLPAVDKTIRNSLSEKYEKEGIESLRFELKIRDPEYYREVDLHNPKRLLHALEISVQTGRPYSEFRRKTIKKRPFSIIKIGLNMPRDLLYERINRRVDEMVAAGLEEEARNLYPYQSINALNTVGYKEWFSCFNGDISRSTAIEQIKSNTRRYARKQLTWFKKDMEITWFDANETTSIIPFIENKISSAFING